MSRVDFCRIIYLLPKSLDPIFGKTAKGMRRATIDMHFQTMIWGHAVPFGGKSDASLSFRNSESESFNLFFRIAATIWARDYAKTINLRRRIRVTQKQDVHDCLQLLILKLQFPWDCPITPYRNFLNLETMKQGECAIKIYRDFQYSHRFISEGEGGGRLVTKTSDH